MALVGVECFLLFEGLDIQDLITFKANVPLILICELVTLFLYISLNYFRFYTYHTALKQYYNKLPKHYKERFTPPPRAQLSAG
jgi:hypothetical protein